MESKEVTIRLKAGLTSNLACHFIQQANQYHCQIHLEYHGHRVNAKSLLGVLSLNIPQDAPVCLIADGEQESAALTALSEFLE